MLATPLNVSILQALDAGAKQQAELIRATGVPAQTTLRAQLKRLVGVGAIDKQRRNRFPGTLEYELATAGSDLLFVTDVLERWLGSAPEGPLHLDGNAAKAAIKALAEAWSSTMLRALASGPLSLTELDGIIGSLSYPSLERRLTSLRLAGLVEARHGNGRGTPYAVTDWLRHGVVPLAAATRWEDRHLPQKSVPLGRLDVETIFLLAAPMLRPRRQSPGSCRLAAEIPVEKRSRLSGVVIEVENGAVASCTTDLKRNAHALATGSVDAWLEVVTGGALDGIELGGNRGLARALIERFHRDLSGTDRRPALDSPAPIREDQPK